MKYFLLYFVLGINALQVYGQADTAVINKFIYEHEPYEKQFITALKSKNFIKSLTFFTDDAKKNFGTDFLLQELKALSELYKKYPNPEVNYSIGLPSQDGTGTFGHDVNSYIELESHYCFRDNSGKWFYDFNIYYTNSHPVGLIKRFSTHASLEKELGH